jgi:para-aminobenzoate synthetase component I
MNIEDQQVIELKMKMLNWADQFNIFCLLDNNGYSFNEAAFECILAIGCDSSFSFEGKDDLKKLQEFYDKNPTWLFGHLGYNAVGNAYKKSIDSNFGNGFLFEPIIIIRFSKNNVEVIKSNQPADILLTEISNFKPTTKIKKSIANIDASISQKEYIGKIKLLQLHIQRGDCYEINFCQKFSTNNCEIDPVQTYMDLCKVSPTPFAALYKLNGSYCICASPERFLKKTGLQLLSQPIKGTSKRNSDINIDQENKKHLQESNKEKSENVMVVDLVRNDMSMICEKGSVRVTELFGIYSFPQVHHMISSIEGKLSADKSFTEIIEACFPMGSMTGAPKQRVMELIEANETEQRDLFSGSIGYITPEADFDFNVVIRSIFYNKKNKQVYFFAGSGITFYSIPEDEYEECMVKVEAMKKVLEK